MSTNKIIGTLEAKHTIDPNGSLNIDVPIRLPPSNFDPGLAFSYHSAAQDLSDLGPGWVIKGIEIIERVAANRAQDGFIGMQDVPKRIPRLTLCLCRFYKLRCE